MCESGSGKGRAEGKRDARRHATPRLACWRCALAGAAHAGHGSAAACCWAATPRRNRGETFNFLPPAKPTAGHAGSHCLLATVTRHAPPSAPGTAALCAVRWLLPVVRRTRPLCTGVASPSRGTAAPPAAPALHPWSLARSGQRHAGSAPVYRPLDPASPSGGTAPADLFLPALSPSQARHWCKVGASEARKGLR
jgi:hypothetical protein